MMAKSSIFLIEPYNFIIISIPSHLTVVILSLATEVKASGIGLDEHVEVVASRDRAMVPSNSWADIFHG